MFRAGEISIVIHKIYSRILIGLFELPPHLSCYGVRVLQGRLPLNCFKLLFYILIIKLLSYCLRLKIENNLYFQQLSNMYVRWKIKVGILKCTLILPYLVTKFFYIANGKVVINVFFAPSGFLPTLSCLTHLHRHYIKICNI